MNNSKDGMTRMRSEGDDIGRLIQHAGARETVPAERLERSRDRVRNHWQQVVSEQRSKAATPRFFTLARAAGLVAVAAIAMVLIGRGIAPAPEVTLATVERSTGEISLDGEVIGQGYAIAAGTRLITPRGSRIALRLSNGQSLRIDQDSQVQFEAADQLLLDRGALYIDTAGATQPGPVRVVTALGTARDIGTQFQVRLSAGAMLVGVRDGLVEVDRDGRDKHEVNAGFQVAFSSAGENEPTALDTDAPDWRWIETVAPPFEMDGASLADYLAWYANETGVELVWANEDSLRRASRITLTGDLENTSPGGSLAVVQRIAPFEYSHEDGQLRVQVD